MPISAIRYEVGRQAGVEVQELPKVEAVVEARAEEEPAFPPPGDEQSGMVVVNLTLSFGFNGAPGEWMMWATGVKQAHEGQAAEEGRPAEATGSAVAVKGSDRVRDGFQGGTTQVSMR